MTQLDSFETSLLAELRSVVEHESRTTSLGHRARHRGPWAIAAAAAAVVVGAVVLVPTLHAEPAWAVSRSGNGGVEVQVNRIEDAAGLERGLAAEGIAADVTYVRGGGQCAAGRYMPLDSPGLAVTIGADHSFHVTIPPGTVPTDGLLVIAASFVPLPDVHHDDGSSETDGFRAWVDAGVTIGPVTPMRRGAADRTSAPAARRVDRDEEGARAHPRSSGSSWSPCRLISRR